MTAFELPASAFTVALEKRGTQAFAEALKEALRRLEPDLPLARLMRRGSMPVKNSLEPVVHTLHAEGGMIRAHVSLFFRSVEAGCACDNDPTPMNEIQECAECRLEIDLDRQTARLITADEEPGS